MRLVEETTVKEYCKKDAEITYQSYMAMEVARRELIWKKCLFWFTLILFLLGTGLMGLIVN